MASWSIYQRFVVSVLLGILVSGGLGAQPIWVSAPAIAQTGNAQRDEALKLLQQGVEQYGATQFDAAEQSYLKALAIYQSLGDRNGQWFSLFFLGNLRTSIRDYQKGNAYLQQSLKLAQELSDRPKQFDALSALAGAATNNDEFERAIALYQQSLAMAQAIPDVEREAKTLENLILLYQKLGNAAQVQVYQQQRNALKNPTPSDPQAKFWQAIQQGQSIQQQGTVTAQKQAIQQFETAIALARQLNQPLLEAVAMVALASAYTGLGERQQAIAANQQALEILRSAQAQNPQIEAVILLSLGTNYNRLGERQKALDAYSQVLKLLQTTGDRSGQATVLNNIATVYAGQGNYRLALSTYEQAIALAQATQDRSSQAKTLNNIGLIYTNLGQYQRALTYFDQALPLVRAQRETLLEATVLNNVATVYVFLGQRPKALDYYKQVLGLVKNAGDRAQEAYALANIGTIYSYSDDKLQSISTYQQALALVQTAGDRNAEAIILSNLGQTLAEAGQFTEAIDYYNRALPIARQVGARASEAEVLAKLGTVAYSQKNYRVAIEYLNQGLDIIQQVGDLQLKSVVLRITSKVHLAAGNLKAAEQTLRNAIAVQETIRQELGSNDINKISIFEEQAATYRLLQQALVTQQQPNAALEIAERGRARAFVELLSRRLLDQAPSTTVETLTVPQIQQVAKAQNATLVEYSILYDELAPYPGERRIAATLLIWVIQPGGAVNLRQVDLTPLTQRQRSLEELVTLARDDIGVRGLGVIGNQNQKPAPSRGARSQFQALHRFLIEPIADLLPTDPNARVIFVPQGALFLVPFAALQDASGKYLIERHTISIAPSIQVLELTRAQRVRRAAGRNSQTNLRLTPDTSLIIGNPTMPKVVLEPGQPATQLPALPGAEREARQIAQLLGTQAITGDRATKVALLKQMPSAQLIHLATHGLLDDRKDDGVPGAIALAPSAGDTGLLTADEILDLKLTATLVVLSACDTGRGKITGDGVIGLSRSFIAAGVPSLVVSLWSVPDAPTATLMTRFYQNLQQNPNKAQALRQAMLATQQQYPNPRDWAAFTLIGEAE